MKMQFIDTMKLDEYFFVDNIVAYKRDSIFELPPYYIVKDTSEILGLIYQYLFCLIKPSLIVL